MMWFLAPLVFLVQGVQWMEWHGSWWWQDDQGYWHKYENYQPEQSWGGQWQDWYDWSQWVPQGHGSWEWPEQMPARGLPAEGRHRSPSPRHIPTTWRGTRHGHSTGVRLKQNPYSMPRIPEQEDEEDDMGLGLNSQPSNMPGSGLPAEGIAPEQIDQMLGMLGELFGARNHRYDNRGYRSQIRRQLRYKLKQWKIPEPSWLEDRGQTMKVQHYRDKAFAWMKALKEGSRVPPPMPQEGLPEEGKLGQVKHLQQQMSDLQQNLQQWVQSLPPVPAEFQNSAEVQNSAEIPHQEGTTPGPTEVESKDESSSSESSMDVEDPRKTRSEPPPSPRPNASTGLPVEGIPMGTAMEVTCENGAVVARPVIPAEDATATAPPTHVEQPVPVGGLPVEGSIQSSVGSSWVPVEETPTEASFNVLDGMETVASEVLEEEEKA